MAQNTKKTDDKSASSSVNGTSATDKSKTNSTNQTKSTAKAASNGKSSVSDTNSFDKTNIDAKSSADSLNGGSTKTDSVGIKYSTNGTADFGGVGKSSGSTVGSSDKSSTGDGSIGTKKTDSKPVVPITPISGVNGVGSSGYIPPVVNADSKTPDSKIGYSAVSYTKPDPQKTNPSSTAKTPISSTTSTASSKTATKKKRPSGGMVFFWVMIIGVAAFLLILGINNNGVNKASASITGNSTVKIGDAVTYKATLSDSDLNFDENTNVIWTVNGKPVKTTKASDKNALAFEFKPTSSGKTTVGVKIGDYENLVQTKTVTVNKAVLTLTPKSYTVTYGDEPPKYSYEASGLLSGDTVDSLSLGGTVTTADVLKVGKNELIVNGVKASNKYDIKVKSGYITVAPKALSLSGNEIVKVYDGTTDCPDCNSLTLNGIVTNDDVKIDGCVAFGDKNVGTGKTVDISGITLTGGAAGNYTLSSSSAVTGTITAKPLTLSGLSAADKIYDGTDKVTFSNIGSLVGIVEGDEVAIGSVEAHFDTNAIGRNKSIVIDKITLVGKDAANYTVDAPVDVRANIFRHRP